jgi:hypothetical protein
MKRLSTSLLALSLLAAAWPVAAAPQDQLACLDNRLSLEQRAAVGALFAEQTADPEAKRVLASGTSAGSQFLSDALMGCAGQYAWTPAQRTAATQYLISLGGLSKIAVAEGATWAVAMERFTPFGLRMLPTKGDITPHHRAMIAAVARGNGVPNGKADEAEESPIMAYLMQHQKVTAAKVGFSQARQ